MIPSCLHHARTGRPLLRQSCIRADHSCSFARCFNSALVILTPPQYNSSGTFRNVPLLLSHACPCAGWFDGYTQSAFVNRKTENFSKKLGSPVMRQSFPAFHAAFSVALIPPFWRCRRSDRSPPSSAHRCIGGRAGFDLARPVLQWLPADFQAGGS